MTKPPIVAFYSLKGGVGRTTALVNAGYLLARQGLRVLLWDFDLDAPNLHALVRALLRQMAMSHVEESRIEYADYLVDEPAIGFADYLVHWEDTGDAPASLDSYLWSFPVGAEGGHIDFFGAGYNGPEYVAKLVRIHWGTFYRRGGQKLLQRLLEQIAAREPAVVLLDARTGMTDIGFTAALQLADLTVLVHRLNPDGIEGIRTIHHLFSRRKSPKLSFLYVASMVPQSEFKLATDLRIQAQSQGIGVHVELPMEPPLFLLDEVYADSRPYHVLTEQYRHLVRLIAERVITHSDWQLLEPGGKANAFQSKVSTLYRLLAYQTEVALPDSGLHFLAVDRRGGLDLRMGIICYDNEIELASLEPWSAVVAGVDRLVIVTHRLADPRVVSAARSQRILITSYAELLAGFVDFTPLVQPQIAAYEESLLAQIYISPALMIEGDSAVRPAEENLQRFLSEPNEHLFIILADFNKGKTALTRKLARDYGTRYLEDPLTAPAPLRIDLKEMRGMLVLEELLVNAMGAHGISLSFQAILFLIQEGRLVILVDGFDEIVSTGSTETARHNLLELTRTVGGPVKDDSDVASTSLPGSSRTTCWHSTVS